MGRIGRRQMLRNSVGLSGALLGGISYEHKALMARLVDPSAPGKAEEPVKGLQRGKLGKYEVSRLIIGGDPISGIAHAGELVYQADFMLQYFNTEKILETLARAEQNGINTLLMIASSSITRCITRSAAENSSGLPPQRPSRVTLWKTPSAPATTVPLPCIS